TWNVSPRYSFFISRVGPSMSSRPCSIVRKPSMWSNDRFSIIRTTMWSILRGFSSASVTSGDRELHVHPGFFVARNGAEEVVRARLQVDRERLRLARVEQRRFRVDAIALDDEVVRDLAVVLDVEGDSTGMHRDLGKRDLELGLLGNDALRSLRRAGGPRLRRRRLGGRAGRLRGGGLLALGLRLGGLPGDEDHRGHHPDEEEHARHDKEPKP